MGVTSHWWPLMQHGQGRSRCGASTHLVRGFSGCVMGEGGGGEAAGWVGGERSPLNGCPLLGICGSWGSWWLLSLVFPSTVLMGYKGFVVGVWVFGWV